MQRVFFSFGVAEALRGGGGAIIRACDIICFENRFGLGTINTPE